MESQLQNDDLGKDVSAVQNIKKKHGMLDGDVITNQETC